MLNLQNSAEVALRDNARKGVEKKAKESLLSSVFAEAATHPQRRVRVGNVRHHRVVKLSQKSFAYSPDIHKLVSRYVEGYDQWINEEKATLGGLEKTAPTDIVNRFKRGYAGIMGHKDNRGYQVNVPSGCFYVSEKSKDIYEIYANFLTNTLHAMTFSSDEIVKDIYNADHRNKFFFVVALLNCLAAQALSQPASMGYTKLLDNFAKDVLLDAKLLSTNALFGKTKSLMYKQFVQHQEPYLELIKARGAEEELSAKAINTINQGLNQLDEYQMVLFCLLMASINSFIKLRLMPEDLNPAVCRATLQRVYQAIVGQAVPLGKVDLRRLHLTLKHHPHYARYHGEVALLLNLLEDIQALRRLLNALASLHETTGWLIIGLSSKVDLSALQDAFRCFQDRFHKTEPALLRIIDRYNHSSNCHSIGTVLQQHWSKRPSHALNVDFETIRAKNVLSYIRDEIESAMDELHKSQAILFKRGLTKKQFILADPNSRANEGYALLDDELKQEGGSLCCFPSKCCVYKFFGLTTLASAAVIGLFFVSSTTGLMIPSLALVVAISVLVFSVIMLVLNARRQAAPTPNQAALFQPQIGLAAPRDRREGMLLGEVPVHSSAY